MAKFNQNQVQAFIGLLVVLAFFAQSIIPAGYMPSFKTGHVFEITICHGAEQSTVIVDENMTPVKGGPEQPPAKNKSDMSKSCVFASASSKHIAFQNFLFQQIDHLTYEAFVERTIGHHFVSVTTSSYFGQGPPTFLS